MLEVTLLGTAATLPRPDRALASAALICNGRALLLDCGEVTQLALHRCRVNPMRIDLICLTHYHGDHVFGLPGLLQTLGTLGRTEPLYITGPEGLEETMRPILTLAEEQPYPIRLLPLPEEGLALSALHAKWPAQARLSAFPTLHRVVSQGYRFHLGRSGRFDAAKALALAVPRAAWRQLQNGVALDLDGRTILPEDVCTAPRRGLTVVFTGDTAPCDALTAAAHDADLLLMDATYAEDAQRDKAALYGHSTFAQAARTAADAQARALWLMHYSGSIETPEAFVHLAQAHFPQAACGQDGMHAALGFEE